MEFNQDNRAFRAPYIVLDTVAEQLADVDLTLPDYCPNIEKILTCTLIPKLRSKNLSGGQLQLEGVCVVNVMYVESEKKTIRCCEQSVDFSQSFSVKDAGENYIVLTKTKSEYINCRALSPRRLVMHGAFSLYAKVISSRKTELFTPDEGNLQTYREQIRLSDLKSNCQEQFTISEEISVADKPAVESILYSKVKAGITDAKAIGGKLMLNGEIGIRLFYLTDIETGETAKLDYLLPFNQIIDCEGIDEDTENIFNCEVMTFDIRLKNDILSDKPALAFDAMLCVSAQGYCSDQTDVITDAYSTEFACAPQFSTLKYIGGVCSVNDVFIEKLTANVSDGKIAKVLDIFADSVSLDTACSDGMLSAKGKINLCILAQNEDGYPVFVERGFDFERVLPSASGCNSFLFENAGVLSVSYRLMDDNSVEIRCEIKICGGAVRRESITALSGVEIFEDKPLENDGRALTLYYASTGESIWDIAKSHNTRPELLLCENSLEDYVLDCDKMLLIPKL